VKNLGCWNYRLSGPFLPKLVRERCASANHIIVVEMNMGQILGEGKEGSQES